MTKTYEIDLGDPRVRGMLDGPRTMVQLAGDAPDPSGSVAGGMRATTQFTAGRQEVLVLYKDMYLTADVYAIPGQPITVHLICPRCHKPLQITGDRKHIDFDPRGRRVTAEAMASGKPEIAALAESGELSIEPFECTWELGDETHQPGIVQSGTSLCRLRIAIDRNRAKDA